MSNYVVEFQGKQFTPDGRVNVSDVSDHNSQVEQAEIAWLRTAPEKCFLYVKHPEKDKNARPGNAHWADPEYRFKITTFLGTVLSEGSVCYVGPRRNIGFGFHTYRRAVSCRIFGVLYHGWYYESSGDYCRLRKAKRQGEVR